LKKTVKQAVDQAAVQMVKAIELWPIESLKPFEKNPRDHSGGQVDQIARSIQEFGFNNPILVRGKQIVAGHGRILAATKLGMAKVPVVRLDHLSREQAVAYLIADNKLALNASWNYDVLAELLAEIPESGMDPTLSGFDTAEIDAIINGWKPDFEQPHPSTHDGPLMARIVVTCAPADKGNVMEVLRTAITASGIDGVEVGS